MASEPPVTATAQPRLAALALRYEPVVVMAKMDRFWPVSVTTLFSLRGPHGPACLLAGRTCGALTSLAELTPGTGDGQFIRFPAAPKDPAAQFRAFNAALGLRQEDSAQWLHDVSADVSATAQEYVYFAPGPPAWDPALPESLMSIQYWFFYGYNYLPTKFRDLSRLGIDPDSAVKHYTDLHEGDWEHVDVVLERSTGRPRYVLMARHSNEDALLDWDSPALEKRELTHPVVYAGFGGHASYNRCGIQHRAPTTNAGPHVILGVRIEDFTICENPPHAPPGSAQPPAGPVVVIPATTRLVELQPSSWACWRGHFGDRLVTHHLGPLDFLQNGSDGPVAPLRQRENRGVCRG